MALAFALISQHLLTGKRRELKEHYVKFLQSGTVVLGRQAVMALQDDSTLALADTVSSLLGRLGATAILIVDARGEVLVSVTAAGRRDLEGDMADRARQRSLAAASGADYTYSIEGEVLLYAAPLKDSGRRTVGGITVLVPREVVEAELLPFRNRILLGGLLLTLLLTLAVSWGFQAVVLEPFRRMEALRVKAAAEGRSGGGTPTEAEVPVQRVLSRTRELLDQLNAHADKLLKHVRALTASVVEVKSMSDEVSSTVQQISKGAEEQAGKVSEVHHLLQEMQTTMKDVEQKAGETAGAVEKAADGARQGGEVAHQTMEKMAALNNAIRRSSDVMNRLGNKSQQIGRVVDIISGIAEQTNLLSLNAAIEAARAGEQGRGFAVVAEEIRKLADESTKATAEITDLIQQVQEGTQEAMVAMEDGSHEAEEGRRSIMQMRNTLEDIISVVENASSSSQNIKGYMEGSKKKADQVVQSVQEINAVSEEYAASTQEISASTQEHASTLEQMTATVRELTGMAAELKSAIEKFKLS
jgi:methyl-accepting chemotaxis protein